jgi:hypothetical protein
MNYILLVQFVTMEECVEEMKEHIGSIQTVLDG